ncbi:MAG: YciI family protein [Cyclobacteriaceae bacterium]
MKEAKEFMMIFRFEPKADYQPTQEEINLQRKQWGGFIGQLALNEKLVSTHQLGSEGAQLAADHSITTGMCFSEGKAVGGNMIVRAKSLEEATEMAKGCPILHMGGTVEIRSITPMQA